MSDRKDEPRPYEIVHNWPPRTEQIFVRFTDVRPGSNISFSGRGIINQAWSREEALPMLKSPPVGGIEGDDTLNLTLAVRGPEAPPESCAEVARAEAADREELEEVGCEVRALKVEREALARDVERARGASERLLKELSARRRRIAMPPGVWMSRIARGVFFFSPKTVERVFEEIIADYRHEMFEAEVAGRTADLRWLRVQYWGAFIKSLVTELAAGSLGRIIRAITGG